MSFARIPFIRTLRYTALVASAQGTMVLARILPRRLGLLLFGAIGSIIFHIPHADRGRTIRHLTMVYGKQWDQAKIKRIAQAVYRELGKNMFDAFLLPRLPFDTFNRLVTHDSIEAVQKAYAEGNGAIMITAHTGCFEMPLHFFGFHGCKTFAIGKKLHDERLDAIISRNRSGNDVLYMNRNESPRQIIRLLQKGMLFGVLIDQDTAVEGVFADFLGRKAYTPSGPVKIAMKRSTPLFVVTSARRPDNTHHVSITGPLQLKTDGTFEDDLVKNVTLVNSLICSAIQTHPEQWVWMHRRWRRRPQTTTSGGTNA